MVRTLEGKHLQYYEATLQLRDVTEAAIAFVQQEIARENIPLAKVVKEKNGYDYFLADSNFTKALGKKLQQKFGGQLHVTATLFGRKDSRAINRLTVLFRGLLFVKGDIVEYKGEPYEVKMVAKDILLQSPATGEKVHLRYKDIGVIRKKISSDEE